MLKNELRYSKSGPPYLQDTLLLQHLLQIVELSMFDQWWCSHHKQLFKFTHLLWIPKCAKILPIGMLMESSNEQQINHLNWLVLPIIALWIPSGFIVASSRSFSPSSMLTFGSLWRENHFPPSALSPCVSSCTWTCLNKNNNRYIRWIGFNLKEPSLNRFWWEAYWLLRFNMLRNFWLCNSNFNLLFLKVVNDNKCWSRWQKSSLKALQHFFKSFSHSGNMLQSFKNFPFYVSCFSRTLVGFLKCRRQPWC